MKMKTRARMRGGFVLPTLSEENEKDEIATRNAPQLSSNQTKIHSRQLKTTKIQFRVRKSQKFAVRNDVATVCKNRKLTEHNLEEDVVRVAQVEAGLEKETESTHASSGLPTKVEITSKAVAEHIVEDVVAARGVQDDAVWNDLKEETEATKTSSCELDTYTKVTTPPQCISSLCVLPATTVEANWCLSLYGGDAIVVATEHLKGVDSKLRVLIEWHNNSPQFEQCTSCFTALARSIIFQQLATKSASAIYTRLSALCEGGVVPSTIAGLSAQDMREVGISGRKASYLHGLADHFITGKLSDNDIVTMDEEALMAALTAVKGIGVWSVHMFMIFWLHKSDVLPIGDLGVRKGFQKLYQLASLPSGPEMEELAACWRPYRSLGAWYLWRLVDATLPFPAGALGLQEGKSFSPLNGTLSQPTRTIPFTSSLV